MDERAEAKLLEAGREKLRFDEERFRRIFEDSATVMLLVEPVSGAIVEANEAAAAYYGYPRERLTRMQVDEINVLPPEQVAAERARAFQEKRTVLHFRHRLASGEIRDVDVSASRVELGGRELLYSFIQDVTERNRAELKLRDSEGRFRAVFEQAALGIALAGFDGRFLDCNQYFADLTGYTRAELITMDFQQITVPEDRHIGIEAIGNLVSGQCQTAHMEKRYLRKDGTAFWASLTVSQQRDAVGLARNVIGFIQDIDARKQAEARLAVAREDLERSEQRYRIAYELTPVGMMIRRESDRVILACNDATLKILGYARDELIDHPIPDLDLWVADSDRAQIRELLRRDGYYRDVEVRFRKKDHEIIWVSLSGTLVEIEAEPCLTLLIQDLSERKKAEVEIRQLAYSDPLTGLPNRRMLMERLEVAIASTQHHKAPCALLFIDLDNFKTLNDALGHRIGDLVLQQAANSISAVLRREDMVARIGGDEFVVLLTGLSPAAEETELQVAGVAEKIMGSVRRPHDIEGHTVQTTCSIGVTFMRGEYRDVHEVMEQSDIALYSAKAAGRNTARFFAAQLRDDIVARASLETDLQAGVEKQQFELWYQPQVEGDRVAGAEALLRWNHPERGILAPGHFIEAAEQTGLILPLGAWALEAACRQMAEWRTRGKLGKVSVSVNISPREFRQPDFGERVQEILAKTGAPPENLILELTEGMMVEDIDDVIDKMRRLKSRGLRFSLDDFGTGCSSLAHLKRLPLDELKIDRVFVRDILTDRTSVAIAQAIITLGRAMSLSVIAEGVENVEQLNCLSRLGCRTYQGFLIGRPLPLGRFEKLLDDPMALGS